MDVAKQTRVDEGPLTRHHARTVHGEGDAVTPFLQVRTHVIMIHKAKGRLAGCRPGLDERAVDVEFVSKLREGPEVNFLRNLAESELTSK